MTIRLLVLGPIEVRVDRRPVPLPDPRLATLVTALVLNANRPVDADRLAHGLRAQPPDCRLARRSDDHAAVSALLDGLPAPLSDRLVRRAGGWLMLLTEDETDLSRFVILARQARAALMARDYYAAAHLFGAALACWRGPAGANCRAYGWLRRQLDDLDALHATALRSRREALSALRQRGDTWPGSERRGGAPDPGRAQVRSGGLGGQHPLQPPCRRGVRPGDRA